MINRLKRLYPTLVTRKDVDTACYNDYQWFIMEQNNIIGIAKKELTSKDIELLSTFLTPYNMQLPAPTKQEKAWLNLIQTNDMPEDMQPTQPFRFVYFSIQKHRIDPQSFKEAIDTIFQRQVPILWNNDYSGVIVEEMLQTNEDNLSYEQIIDTLMSDLYVKMTFFVGVILHDCSDAKLQYDVILKGAEIAFAYSEKSVLTYIDIVPFLFIEEMDTCKRDKISETVLKETINDTELLDTMEAFMLSNLNISETAKELYMHRNSLQYRLDKFYEKTGLDVRQFPQAMTLYLILLANK